MRLLPAALALSALAGCDLVNDCTENPNLPCYVDGSGGSGGEPAGASDPSGGGGGEDAEQ